METSKLEAFIAFAQTENVRKAAELIHVSPGALSKTLHSLGDELGIPLLAPVGRQVVLTQEAQLFLPHAKRIVDEWKAIKNTIEGNKIALKESPLRLATFEVFSTYFLSGLKSINWTRGLKLHEAVPGEIERHILSGEADLGITYLPVPHPRLDFLKIVTVEMGVFVCKNAFKNIDQPHIPFVVPIAPLTGTPTKAKGLDGWPESNYERDVLYEVTLLESGLELCRQGRCAGYFPVFIVDEHNRRVRPEFELVRKMHPTVKHKCYSEVYLVKPKSMPENDLVKKVAKMIRNVCN